MNIYYNVFLCEYIRHLKYDMISKSSGTLFQYFGAVIVSSTSAYTLCITRGAARGGGRRGIYPHICPPTLKYRGPSMYLSPPHFYHNIYCDWFVI